MKNQHFLTKFKILIFILCFLMIIGCQGITKNNSPVIPSIDADIILTGDWLTIDQDGYQLYNNVWGKEDIMDGTYQQYIFLTNEGVLCPFGWGWDWPYNAPERVKAYPEILYGQSPWGPTSQTEKLPIAISAITNFSASYDIEASASGRWNLALEFWTTSDAIPTRDNITAEVMIWIDKENFIWFPPLVEKVTFDGEEYNFYKGHVDHGTWSYLCFLKLVPEYKGDTKFHLFIDYLVANNHIDFNDYVAVLDFGNEIWYGKGQTKFLEYSVTVE